MTDPAALSRAFLVNRPASAARQLEEIAPADAAAFLATCPPETVAPVLIELADDAAARLLALIDVDTAAAVLRAMPANEIAFILRRLDDARREALLRSLPRRLAPRVRQLLAYSQDQLGAWTESDLLTLDPDLPVGDALARARTAKAELEDPLFLVAAGRAYQGAVRLPELLRAQPGRRVGGLVARDLAPLIDRGSLAAVAGLDVWAIYNRVPVVDRHNRFVGVLTEHTMRHALEHGASASAAGPGRPAGGGDALLQLGAGYVGALSGALHLLLARRS